MSTPANAGTVAIVGGGVSGALTAYHLLRAEAPPRVVLIEPRAELGLGLAYATPSLRHLLNVPADKISALPDEPHHFLAWLQAHHDPEADEETFAPRAIFGRYVHTLVGESVGLEHVQANVMAITPAHGGALLKLDRGPELHADLVVLATGNCAPAPLPGVAREVVSAGAYCQDAWAAATYQDLDPGSPVALIGSGLTSVDVLLRLRELGHRGTITAISRHGVLPEAHAPHKALAESAIPAGTAPTCLAYLRALRSAVRNGAEWRAAVDSVRATTNNLWLALPTREQSRFRRHLQRRWDVLRHRMAPAIAEQIQAELKAGTLVLRDGRVVRIDRCDSGARVTYRDTQGERVSPAARVINCTGPALRYREMDSPLFQDLFRQGLVSAGPLGDGFCSNREGAINDSSGKPSRWLYNLGPGRIGTLLESIAVPEIRTEAAQLAASLLEVLRQRCRNQSETLLAPQPCTETAAA